ncbi:MAG: flagellar hook-associated protein FlgK [Ruminococcus flavefaciens]|nr:flagellar hook-associated protein FlgK [Ruminococcus flavefaciens]
MPSQFFGLTIAGSGLRASNAALNTTANNIANAQTTGYSRQVVTQQAYNALRTFTTYGCAGAGVETIAIERVRDNFYDVKYWNNNSKYGEYSAKQYYMRTIEDYFNDDGTSGFVTVFNKFSAALQSVTTNASGDTAKMQFIATAKSLTDYFNNMYGNLQELQKDINLEIKENVDRINAIADKLTTLNKQINVVELSGTTANELRDQRELLIDELSEIVDVEAEEMPIYDAGDPSRVTGANRYVVRIAGGQLLVDGTDARSLEYVARAENEKINQTDADGLYRIMWYNGNELKLSSSLIGGKLKGLIDMRDGKNSSNFTGTVTDADKGTKKVTIEVSKEFLKDMTDCSLSDTGGEIIINNTRYYYNSWEYDGDKSYTFELDLDRSESKAVPGNGCDARVGNDIKYQGIPYYMEQMNSWIRGFAEKVNEIFTEGLDINGDKGCIFFTGKKTNSDGEYDASDLGMTLDGANPADADTKGYYYLTAGNLTINTELLNNASRLGTRSASSETGEVEEFGQVTELITLLNSKEKFSFRNGSANQMLELILADVALNASEANTFYNTFKGLQTSIDNQRCSISGVDEDEEAVNLVKYQNSYTLASKMIQTLTEVYDQLILRTGV